VNRVCVKKSYAFGKFVLLLGAPNYGRIVLSGEVCYLRYRD